MASNNSSGTDGANYAAAHPAASSVSSPPFASLLSSINASLTPNPEQVHSNSNSNQQSPERDHPMRAASPAQSTAAASDALTRPWPLKLVGVETERQLLDRWALALADWAIPRWDLSIREVDGWRTVSGMHGGFVRDCSLTVFVLLGAAEEMPFSVYRELDSGNEETIEPAVSWLRDLRARRLLQSALSLVPAQPLAPPPSV